MRARRCETCRFWDQIDPNNGFCHRAPPGGNGSGSWFVATGPIMWCGEWKLRLRRFLRMLMN